MALGRGGPLLRPDRGRARTAPARATAARGVAGRGPLRGLPVLAALLTIAAALLEAPLPCFTALGRLREQNSPSNSAGTLRKALPAAGDGEAPREVSEVFPSRRSGIIFGAAAFILSAAADEAGAFTPSDLGVQEGASSSAINLGDTDKSNEALKKALYLISRVQEATVQQERLITTGKFKDTQRDNVRRALVMMTDNYKLSDQVITASGFLPTSQTQAAVTIGNEAVDAIETSKEFFSKKLQVSKLTEQQRTFIAQGMRAACDKLEKFVSFMPQDVLAAARKQVEDENKQNLAEYVDATGGGAGIINPVKLPWKK